MLVKSCRLIADKHVVFYITIMMIYFSILHPDCYWTRPEKMPRIQWMGCAVIYREILYLSGFTYKGNNHWKLQVNNISGGWGDLTRGLGGGGLIKTCFFFSRVEIHLGRVFATNSNLVILHTKRSIMTRRETPTLKLWMTL